MDLPSKNKILEILERVEGNGRFCSSGEVETSIIGLHIKDIGNIGFPIHPLLIDELIKKAHKAPFGKGSQTLLDENVRRTWQIDAQDISFSNHDSWTNTFNKILRKVKKDLGLKDKNIEAQLHKLLIYEEGDFFLPHQDSEKEKGMFGTLNVGLPLEHTGGALTIKFNGAEETIDFSKGCNNYKLPFAAFYADCEHQVHPVRSGYRLILTYNLLQLTEEKEKEITSPKYMTLTHELSKILMEMENELERPIPILLDHQYTPNNFSLENLKNSDQPKVEIILQAARQADYYAHPALLTYYQTGAPEWDYDDNEGNSEMDEIFDESLSIEHWVTNEFPDLGNYDLDKEELVSAYKLTDTEPIEKEEEGYMGNYGPSLDYWYHYGAVLIWPKKLHKLLLNDLSIAVRLNWLEYYHNHWNNRDHQTEAIVRSLTLSFKSYVTVEWNFKDLDFSIVLKILRKIDDADYVKQVDADLLTNIFVNVSESEWVALFTHYNEDLFTGLFKKILNTKHLTTISHFVKFLALLLQQSGDRYHPFITDQLRKLAPRIEYTQIKNNKLWGLKLRELVRCLVSIDDGLELNESLVKDLSSGLFKNRNRKFVNAIINELISWQVNETGMLMREMIAISSNHLKNRVADQPLPPPDWAREVPTKGRYGDVWKMLAPFLRSPTQTVYEYRQRKDRRDRVETTIRNVTIDLKTETIRKGSPHTLKITKTQAAFIQKQKQWKEDAALLKRLEGWFH